MTWYDMVLSMCNNIDEADVWTVLDIAVDNGLIGTVDATAIGKILGLDWSPEDLPWAGPARVQPVRRLYQKIESGMPGDD